MADSEATAAQYLRENSRLRAEVVAAGCGSLVDRLLAREEHRSEDRSPGHGRPSPTRLVDRLQFSGGLPPTSGGADISRSTTPERLLRWLERQRGSAEWHRTGRKRAKDWLQLIFVYCESHIEAWYVGVDLKATPMTRQGNERWVVRLSWPPHPEAGQRPPVYLVAQSFHGVCAALHEELGTFDVQELLDALREVGVWDVEVAEAAALWNDESI